MLRIPIHEINEKTVWLFSNCNLNIICDLRFDNFSTCPLFSIPLYRGRSPPVVHSLVRRMDIFQPDFDTRFRYLTHKT